MNSKVPNQIDGKGQENRIVSNGKKKKEQKQKEEGPKSKIDERREVTGRNQEGSGQKSDVQGVTCASITP